MGISGACLPPETRMKLVGGEDTTAAGLMGGKFAMFKFFSAG